MQEGSSLCAEKEQHYGVSGRVCRGGSGSHGVEAGAPGEGRKGSEGKGGRKVSARSCGMSCKTEEPGRVRTMTLCWRSGEPWKVQERAGDSLLAGDEPGCVLGGVGRDRWAPVCRFSEGEGERSWL